MSGQLNAQGVVSFFSDSVGGKLTAMNLGWPAVFGLLNVVYFGLHYMFASQTAHVGALYAAFLAMMTASGKSHPNLTVQARKVKRLVHQDLWVPLFT